MMILPAFHFFSFCGIHPFLYQSWSVNGYCVEQQSALEIVVKSPTFTTQTFHLAGVRIVTELRRRARLTFQVQHTTTLSVDALQEGRRAALAAGKACARG